MRLRSRRIFLGQIGTAVACLLGVASASGQTAPEQKPLLAEDVFKNVQILKGVPVNEFMATMGFFAASLGYNCTNCHVQESLGNWARYADDIPAKRMARTMIQMVTAFNKSNFGGRRVLTCYTCHRGLGIPKFIPSLAEQYGIPVDDPNEVEIVDQDSKGPAVDQVLNRYVQALGGAGRRANLTSFAAKGTYVGYDTDSVMVPVDVFAKAPGQRTTIVHGPLGDGTTTYNGRAGWIAGPDKPVPVLMLPPGPDLDGLALDANLSFPGGIKQALGEWRAGFPASTINDRDMDVVQGMTAGKSRVKLFFDKESGLLVRIVRFADTVVGIVPTQIDYSDYRDVSGVKMPFKWTVTWTDGQSTIVLNEVRANISIDEAKFARPTPPAAPQRRPAVR
ncbi:MAG TPA: photosynthetic reaction center cytochrome c subunit family protein [Blastocatellia bacterium]|nr:photosynthetic reaction center cytochrome c subunit family protein [Blastocatellia bacterium]